MSAFREQYTRTYLKEVVDLISKMEEDLVDKINKIAHILFEARAKKNTIFFMGNGGSAATASHFVGDLSKGTIVEGFPREGRESS